MKDTTLIFYGRDGTAAKDLAATIRANREHAQIRHAEGFNGEREPCERVITLPCVTELEAARIVAVYGDAVEPLNPTVPPPPPLAPPPSPLDSLPAAWADQSPTEDLKRIAAAVNDGRAVENRKQAIEVIEQALAARK